MRLSLSIFVLLISVFQTSCQNPGEGGLKNISATEFQKLLTEKKEAQLIDVRTQKEFRERHLKGATLMNINEPGFDELIAGLDKSKPVFVYCLGGGRSASAASKMKAAGFVEVYNMKGGILEWTASGLPVEQAGGAVGRKGLSMKDFESMLHSKQYVLVDYHAIWCGPCKKIAPVMQKFADSHKEKLVLLKIDADENPDLMKEKGIQAIPYIELYRDGQLIWKHAGLITEQDLIKAAGF